MEDFKPFSFNDDNQEKENREKNINQNIPYVHYVTATGGTRIGASVLDIIFCLIASIPLFMYAANHEMINNLTRDHYQKLYITIMLYMGALQFFVQFLIPLFTGGKTLGKACLHLRIISIDGGNANAGQLFFRSTVYTIVPILEDLPVIGGLISLGMFVFWIVSLAFIFKDALNQSLHDKMSGVVVIDEYATKRYQNRSYEERNYKERNDEDDF
jgi:uncharacterized RDD family membrane protein YckC